MCGLVYSRNILLDDNINHEFLSNRGPDFNQRLNIGNVSLVHYRLKIYDLSDQYNQPYTTNNKNYLLFNGSIYNYKELAKKYNLGNPTSDTHILYLLLIKFGASILNELNGMFSIVFYDHEHDRTLIARDRYGIKPLFYFQNSKQFLVSSSPKLIAKTMNLDVNNEYVKFGLVNGFYDEFNTSPYENVIPIKPARVYTLENEKFTSNSYYKIKVGSDKVDFTNSDLESILEDAIKIRLDCDRKVACSQSGGVDSSIISYIGSKYNHFKTAFCFGKSQNSEYSLAEEHCKNNNINLIGVVLKKDQILEEILHVLNLQEAPYLSPSIIAQHLIFKEAKKNGYTVMLGGQGADEIFCGYKKYLLFKSGDLRSYLNIILELFIGKYNFKHIFTRIFNKSMYKDFKSFKKLSIDMRSASMLSYADITSSSLPTLLRYEDRNSMGNSIESRLPYLDYRIVDYAAKFDKKNFINKGYTKFFLRYPFNKKISKKILWNRYKRGFDTSDYFESKDIKIKLYEFIVNNQELIQDKELRDSIKYINMFNYWPLILSLLWIINEKSNSSLANKLELKDNEKNI